jgi:uncharacterized lipoprotein NlpE involved in copper resistance
MRRLFSVFPVVMLAVLLAACSNASATTSSSTASTPTTTNCLTLATGTIQSVSNNSLLVANLQGKDVQVTFTSATIFVRQATLTPADLKAGMPVTVTVKQNADNTYSALTVSLRNSQTRQGGFTNGSRLCSAQFPRRTGTPGAFGGRGSGGGQSRQTINGTLSQINGNALTVTDTSGNDFTVTLTATTRMTAQQTISASDLHSGEAVTITGTTNSQGVISASSVSILQGLPNRRPAATPTANS